MEDRVKIVEQNWMQVETNLEREVRAVLPLGSTEQHAHLSLGTDAILAERVAVEAAEPLGVPVFPALAYGISPYFRAYPGSISLRVDTYLAVVRDVLDSLAGSGFQRILVVNGHGGNAPAQALAGEWMADHPDVRVRFHNWWNAPRTWAKVMEIDPVASHGSWMENFPWTRVAGVSLPPERKPMVDLDRVRLCDPQSLRNLIGDGNYGGYHQRPDADMEAIWKVAVEETREMLERSWT
jgi:creatinine amidohydrolase